ncbi:DUF732 domain-containing protein [Rhodococcus ruber]|uniref:DUF732 domain-containing protein n=1 Tax=Rhodococcus ruber TaxID=1830 RepID=UPI001933CC34|nr:DUF732 domain-containing protein [Rhodococcus ruber]QRE81837.1 DUF732 domain-containing protein [Rhodococcus ruber]
MDARSKRQTWIAGVGALVFLAVLLAVVEFTSRESDTTAPTATTATTTTRVAPRPIPNLPRPPAPTVPAVQNDRFLNRLDPQVRTGNSNAELIRLGHLVCDQLAAGESGSYIATILVDSGFSLSAAIELIDAAQDVYC